MVLVLESALRSGVQHARGTGLGLPAFAGSEKLISMMDDADDVSVVQEPGGDGDRSLHAYSFWQLNVVDPQKKA